MDTPILLSKLRPPRIRTDLVSRQRLIDQLAAGLSGKLTIVSSPAGFGKTTLLSQWLAAAGLPVAWVSLDEGDNDLTLFLTYLVAALRKVNADVDDTALSLLRSPQPDLVNAALVVLLNQIEHFPDDFVLVLDDYHLIQDVSIHRAVDYLLSHLPPKMHIVLVTRADPPLHLARLRGQNQLTELRMGDLRFTPEEAVEYFRIYFEGHITERDILRLCSRTEGWISGLQMAAVSMHGVEDIRGFVRSFSGTHRYILDYLFEEALKQQTEGVQTFLFQTAILTRLTAPLCDAVTGRGDSQEILNQLEKSNLFINPLDDKRCWFRYHRLFSDLLKVRLEQNLGSQIPDLHLKASQWYEHNGMLSPAIDHALSAKDYERAFRLLEAEAEAALMRSEISTFLRWMDQLPDERIEASPEMNFLFAWGEMMMGRDFNEVLARVVRIEDGGEWLGGRVETLQAFIAISRVDMVGAETYAVRAMESLDNSDTYFRVIALWIMGITRAIKQDLAQASQALNELLVLCKDQGGVMFTVMTASNLARALMRRGKLAEAEMVFQDALDSARDRQGALLPIAGEALMGLGELNLELNQLDQAADYLLEGIELTRQWRSAAAMEGYLTLAWVKQALGDPAAAQDAVDKAMAMAIEYRVTDLDDRMVELNQVRLWLVQGSFDRALAWEKGLRWTRIKDIEPFETQDPITYHLYLRESVIIARLKYLQGQYAQTLEMLELQLPIFQGMGRLNAVTELLILKALVYDGLREKGPAMLALKTAFDIAEPAGFTRIFLDFGQALRPLLERARLEGIHPAYVDRLLADMEGHPPKMKTESQPLVEPLSDRELEVLRQLQTNLTTPEIADQMMIGVSTVRTHIKNIYAKLSVHKRSEAVNRADDLGLF